MDLRLRYPLLVALVALLTGLVALPSPFWGNDVWDSFVEGSRSPLDIFATKVWGSYYRPLHILLLGGLHGLLGPDPAAWHLLNALLLSAGTLAIYVFHRRMGGSAFLAAAASLLYAAAPPTWFNLFQVVEAELMAVPLFYTCLLLFLHLGRGPGERRTLPALLAFALLAFAGVFLKESLRGLLAIGVAGLAYPLWREKRLTRPQWLAGTLAVAATLVSLLLQVSSTPNVGELKPPLAEMGAHIVFNLYQFTSPLLFTGVLALALLALPLLPRFGLRLASRRGLPLLAVAGLLLPLATTFLLATPFHSWTFWESLFPPRAMEPLLALYALLTLGALSLLAWRGEQPHRTYALLLLLGLASAILGTAFSPTVRSQTTSRSLITFFPLLAWLVVDALRRLRAPENHRVARGAALACILLLTYHLAASDLNVAQYMDTSARAETQVKPAFLTLDLTERHIYSTYFNAFTALELQYMVRTNPATIPIHTAGLPHPGYRVTPDRGLVTPQGTLYGKHEVLPVDYIYYERWRMETSPEACRQVVGEYRNWYLMLSPEYAATGYGCLESPLNQSLRENTTTIREAALAYTQVPRWLEDIPYRLHRGLPTVTGYTYLVGIYHNQTRPPGAV
ncbi:MAG: hypothetical protein HY558_03985 [Euryarchaeota archaeon]|nr:hypothetical protein [Euryarchaeota archaeon]